ncbi:DUF4153 domain-containing protein [Sedimentitalea sp. JM2-8]|uniref:DUF4153 domain-containing protein n=1 Tax=Sedimentitalea xiamensis TaxID=3050037 RepID=A0ABT7FJ99_9RHOB|nr:DUF4153 domain-containing protein [Sedimentitalea xiamensis]MDK3075212.1 DUF4153 domain-containing protein [Sedimentitalea xiamensis]
MAQGTDLEVAAHRAVMVVLGGMVGLALWALGGQSDGETLSPAIYLALFSFAATFGSISLALAGPVSIPRALMGALFPAIGLAALVSVAGLRELVATDLLDDPVMLSVAAVLVLFFTPFLLVWLSDRTAGLAYARLFDAAWTMTVRYILAWGFVAVFWLVAFLSNALLGLVDVTVVDILLRTDWARFGISGAVLGLGLAVIYELRDTISPYPMLRLLRLLVPVMLVVVLVFLVAVPVRGLTHLFGELSAASILLGAAVAAITLISTALDRGDESAVRTAGIRAATRGLALLSPALGVLAVWAVVLRVQQYGWTPDRILAVTVALFLLIYGLGYAASVVKGRGWMARIRGVNVVMAIAVMAVCVAWMTPILNVDRLSVNSQISRFETGRSTLDQLALWQMEHGWGRAGQDGLQRLEAMTQRPDHDAIVARIVAVRGEINRYGFEQSLLRQMAPERAGELFSMMPVRPEDAGISVERLQSVPMYLLDSWLKGCTETLPDGRAGCVLVKGAFVPAVPVTDQAIVVFLDPNGSVRANYVLWRDGEVIVRGLFDPGSDTWPDLTASDIADLLDGAFDIRPSGANALFLNGATLAPLP